MLFGILSALIHTIPQTAKSACSAKVSSTGAALCTSLWAGSKKYPRKSPQKFQVQTTGRCHLDVKSHKPEAQNFRKIHGFTG